MYLYYTIDLYLFLVYKGGRLINNEDMIMLMNVLSAFIISPRECRIIPKLIQSRECKHSVFSTLLPMNSGLLFV